MIFVVFLQSTNLCKLKLLLSMNKMFTAEIHCSGAEQWFRFVETDFTRLDSDWLDSF
jgi:hypothetical protein